jgi:hypothetical protein
MLRVVSRISLDFNGQKKIKKFNKKVVGFKYE